MFENCYISYSLKAKSTLRAGLSIKIDKREKRRRKKEAANPLGSNHLFLKSTLRKNLSPREINTLTIFLSSGGTSTGADVAMCVCLSLQKIGFETAETRLAPGSTIQVYSDKATVQVYNSTNS
jgi:hypothetical protein